MSVELSEKHRSFVSPKFPAERRDDRSASASEIRGELTSSFVVAPCPMIVPVASVNIQAKPALLERTSQAASDRQITASGSSLN